LSIKIPSLCHWKKKYYNRLWVNKENYIYFQNKIYADNVFDNGLLKIIQKYTVYSSCNMTQLCMTYEIYHNMTISGVSYNRDKNYHRIYIPI